MPIDKKLERYLEWLEREEIPPERAETITGLRSQLRQQLGLAKGEHLPRTAAQLNALRRAAVFVSEQAPKYGVTPTSYKAYGKITTRYTISGMKGLFGMKKAIHELRARLA
jgi:hypothetical protein